MTGSGCPHDAYTPIAMRMEWREKGPKLCLFAWILMGLTHVTWTPPFQVLIKVCFGSVFLQDERTKENALELRLDL